MMAGSSVPHLAEKVAGHLQVPLMKVKCGRFSDGEVELQASKVPFCVCLYLRLTLKWAGRHLLLVLT
jgi:hypothetical protein